MAAEHVVLLHGLGRSWLSMLRLERALRRDGYRVHNVDYPSRQASIQELAREHVGAVVQRLRDEGAGKIHFVTHSMGGILVRQYVAEHGLPEIGRVVMIAPPNAGSEVADVLCKWLPARWWCGPALHELGTGDESVPLSLGPVPFETGVIAGRRRIFPWFDRLLGEPNDGLVRVEATRVAGAAEWIEVPYGHSLPMWAGPVVELVLRFLRTGTFEASEGD